MFIRLFCIFLWRKLQKPVPATKPFFSELVTFPLLRAGTNAAQFHARRYLQLTVQHQNQPLRRASEDVRGLTYCRATRPPPSPGDDGGPTILAFIHVSTRGLGAFRNNAYIKVSPRLGTEEGK